MHLFCVKCNRLRIFAGDGEVLVCLACKMQVNEKVYRKRLKLREKRELPSL